MVKGDLSVNIGGVGVTGGVCQLLLFRLVQKLEHPLSGSGHELLESDAIKKAYLGG